MSLLTAEANLTKTCFHFYLKVWLSADCGLLQVAREPNYLPKPGPDDAQSFLYSVDQTLCSHFILFSIANVYPLSQKGL